MSSGPLHFRGRGADGWAVCGVRGGRTSRNRDLVKCRACLARLDNLDGPTPDQLTARAIAARTVLVGGRRRQTLLCECSALMVAGIDHTCRGDADGHAVP